MPGQGQERLPEHGSAAVCPGLDGAHGDIEGGSGVVVIDSLDVDEEEGPADFLGQALKRVDDLLVGEGVEDFLGGLPLLVRLGTVGRIKLDLMEADVPGRGTGGAQAVDASMAHDCGQPSFDIRAFLETVDGAEGLEQRFLSQILGLSGVAGEDPGDAQDGRPLRPDEVIELPDRLLVLQLGFREA